MATRRLKREADHSRPPCAGINAWTHVDIMKCQIYSVIYSSTVSCRLQLKCDGIRWRTGGEVKGKLANRVGSWYPAHYLGTRCIQHYYHWCAHPRLSVADWTEAPRRFKWTRPFRLKTKSGFLACAITFQQSSTEYDVPLRLPRSDRLSVHQGLLSTGITRRVNDRTVRSLLWFRPCGPILPPPFCTTRPSSMNVSSPLYFNPLALELDL